MNAILRRTSVVLALALCSAGAQALQAREAPGAKPAAQPGARPAVQPGEQVGGRARVSGPAAGSPSYDYVKKVGVVGASVSAGFGLESRAKPREDLGKREAGTDGSNGAAAASARAAAAPQTARGWTDLIDDSIMVDHGTVKYASMYTFADPQKQIADQLAKARADGATSLVAIDGLFWFAYGQRPEEQRAPLFEAGLALYAEVKTPLILGDLPLMPEGPMLRASMIPTSATLALLNARLAEWAKGRPNVAIVPLAKAAAAMQSGEDVVAWGHVYPTKGAKPVLQADKLHTTYEGNLALWSLTLDTWATLVPAGEPLPFRSSPMDMQMARNFRHGTSDEVHVYARTEAYPADSVWRGRGPARAAEAGAQPLDRKPAEGLPREGREGEGRRGEGRPEGGTPPERKAPERKPVDRKPGG